MSDLAFPKKPKKSKKAKLTPAKVQPFFNTAIRRRDMHCVMTHSECSGNYEASHFFAVKSNGALRFYPPNVHTQCSRHHLAEYHNDNPLPYVEFMMGLPELEWMEQVRKRTVKYSQETLATILSLCKADDLEGVKVLIERLIEV